MRLPDEEPPLSRNEIIATEALRRRARAMAERCLPTIIAEANYEQLDELFWMFWFYGSPEAMRLEAPEGYHGVPGLTLDESNALVRFRIKRGDIWAPPGHPDSPQPGPPTPANEQPWGRATPAKPEPPAPSAVETPGPAGSPAPAPPKPKSLVRIWKHGRMWFADPKTHKVVSEAPL